MASGEQPARPAVSAACPAPHLRQLAEQGDAESQRKLAEHYAAAGDDRCRLCAPDGELATRWMTAAARAGDAMAQLLLGFWNLRGRYVLTDKLQAAHWFRRAAEQGVASAQHNLGVCYHFGIGLPHDDRQALYWYRRAAAQNLSLAEFSIASLLMSSDTVAPDEAEAVMWLRRAADHGHPGAMNNLGMCYMYGIGFDGPDAEEAARWFERAAAHGLPDAVHNLKVCREQQARIRIDPAAARRGFRASVRGRYRALDMGAHQWSDC